jgi:hypothetical protein
MLMAAFSFNFTDNVTVSLFELLARGSLANKHGPVYFRTINIMNLIRFRL